MVRLRRFLPVLALSLGLAGCFTGKSDLIGDDKAVAPFAKIVYGEEGSADRQTLIRDGKLYRVQTKDGEKLVVRFMDTGDNTYVATLGFNKDGEDQYLYAFLKVDPVAKTATGFKVVAGNDDANPGPGLKACDESQQDQVCVESLDAYVAYARKAMAAGAKPDEVWEYTTE